MAKALAVWLAEERVREALLPHSENLWRDLLGTEPVAPKDGKRAGVQVWPLQEAYDTKEVAVVVYGIAADWRVGLALLQRRTSRVRIAARGVAWRDAGRLVSLAIRALREGPGEAGIARVHIVSVSEGSSFLEPEASLDGSYWRFADVTVRG